MLGLVNVLVNDPASLQQEALALAARITANAPLAVRKALQLVENSTLSTDDENWQMSTNAFKELQRTEDYYEGPKAFVAKRPPQWSGKMLKSKI